MSELPDERAGAPAEGAKRQAWTSVDEARASWSGAMRAHEQAPPDPGFRDRLRSLLRLRPRCATRTPERSRQDWHGGPSLTPNGRVRPTSWTRDRPPRPGRALGPLRRGSAPAQPGRRRRHPERRCRRLRRGRPGRLGVGRRATRRGRVTRKRPRAQRPPASTGSAATRNCSYAFGLHLAVDGGDEGAMTAAHASMSPAAGRAARGPRSGGFDPRCRLGRDLLHAGLVRTRPVYCRRLGASPDRA